MEGVPDLAVEASDPGSERTAELVRGFLSQSREILADEPVLNGFLARGFACYEGIPTQQERFGLRGVAVAKYPMYRGVARLVGMEVQGIPVSTEATVAELEKLWGRYDLYFLHFKDTDTRGHDGDFNGKVAAIEEVDRLIPRIVDLAQRIIRATLGTILDAAGDERGRTALILVGPALAARDFGESRLYAGDYDRRFRPVGTNPRFPEGET